MIEIIKKIFHAIGSDAVPATSHIGAQVAHLQKFVSYKSTAASKPPAIVDFDHLRITWIIPDFTPGAGGHMTIFRIAHYLEHFGHDVKFLIQNPTVHMTGADAKAAINQHFQPFHGEVALFEGETPEIVGDALIATDRFTCYPVDAMTGFHRKFYFVQDYEPSFYPSGAEALLSEATYHFDFDCLCAGDWLHKMMSENYGRWSASWPLAYDPKIYHLNEADAQRSVNRIALYARFVTPRRAVELAFMALEKLQDRGVDFEVDFFGWDVGNLDVGYPYRNHGVLDGTALANLYRQATVGVVFSATNHSLVNREMMACGLPVVDLDVDSVRAVFPESAVARATPTAKGIADQIQAILEDETLQDAMRKGGFAHIDGLSWEVSARLVEGAIRERVAAALTGTLTEGHK